ncbi:MAG TPA: hypothetical protein VFI38_17050 [Candidatus Acidoferrum sp.]|nr:hypothetical protein [Candidatus Acidoferrum sp.]
MNARKLDPILILLTSSGGLVSALIIVGTSYPLGQLLVSQHNKLSDFSTLVLPGFVFGAIVSGCFALRGYSRGLWQVVAITAASSVAYFLSFMAAAEFSLHPLGLVPIERIGEVTDLALVVGGLTGGFCTICVVSLLFNSGDSWQRRLFKALCWTPVGAVLAVAGWALGPSLGIALWQIIHSMNLTAPTETVRNAQGSPSHMFSLLTIWQAGMGLVLGLVVNGKQPTAEELKPGEFSSITKLIGGPN